MDKHTLAAPLAAMIAAVAPAWTRAEEAPVTVQIVDALNQRYGTHPGFRSNHAKGIVVEGGFSASPEAAMLSRSPLFTGAKLPVTVRFSDAGGLPDIADASPEANPHGMAIKFHLPDGGESDIVANSLKFFPVATPEEFRDLQRAAAASPPGSPKPTPLEAFLAGHPGVGKALATLGTPDSFADEQYHGIDAFVFVDRAGHRQAFRYIIAPERVRHLGKEEAARLGPDALMEELPARLAKGPVIFHLKAQLAADGDSTHDPTQAWPDERKTVDLGVLTLDRVVPDGAASQKSLLFLPGRLTDGIEPSDDPLIAARDGAYAVSFARRAAKP